MLRTLTSGKIRVTWILRTVLSRKCFVASTTLWNDSRKSWYFFHFRTRLISQAHMHIGDYLRMENVIPCLELETKRKTGKMYIFQLYTRIISSPKSCSGEEYTKRNMGNGEWVEYRLLLFLFWWLAFTLVMSNVVAFFLRRSHRAPSLLFFLYLYLCLVGVLAVCIFPYTIWNV